MTWRAPRLVMAARMYQCVYTVSRVSVLPQRALDLLVLAGTLANCLARLFHSCMPRPDPAAAAAGGSGVCAHAVPCLPSFRSHLMFPPFVARTARLGAPCLCVAAVRRSVTQLGLAADPCWGLHVRSAGSVFLVM